MQFARAASAKYIIFPRGTWNPLDFVWTMDVPAIDPISFGRFNRGMNSKANENDAVSVAQCEPDAAQKLHEKLTAHLLDRHGPIIGTGDLWQILKYRSKDAFERSYQRGKVDLPFFKLPGRDGLFVLAPVLAEQVIKLSTDGQVNRTWPPTE